MLHLIKNGFKKANQRWFSLLFSLLSASALLFYITNFPADWQRLRMLSPINLLILSSVLVVAYIIAAIKFRISATIFGVNLTYSEAFMLIVSGSLINIIPFSAIGFRMLYLKKVHGLKIISSGLGTLAIWATAFASAGLLGLIGLMALFFDGIALSWLLVVLFVSYLFVFLAVWSLGWYFSKSVPKTRPIHQESQKQSRWQRLFDSIRDSFEMFINQPQVIMQFLLLNMLTNLNEAIRFWLISRWLDYPINLAQNIVVQSVSQIAALATILPNSTIGLREAFAGLGTSGLGMPTVTGIMISTVDRVITLMVLFYLGTISLWILRRRIIQSELSVNEII